MDRWNVAIVLFEEVEVLDFAGPYEARTRTRVAYVVELLHGRAVDNHHEIENSSMASTSASDLEVRFQIPNPTRQFIPQ